MAKVLHDFAGKPKTSETYDKDWVFQNGAWITKRQARRAHQESLEQRQANRLQQSAVGAARPMGAPPVPPTTAVVNLGQPVGANPLARPMPGAGTNPLARPMPGAGTNPYARPLPGQPTPPSWWIPTVYTNPDESQSYANAVNALLPTLSPEDQRTMANYLATNYKDVYGGYANAQFSPIPTKLTEERNQYLNPARANQALNILNRVQQTAGGTGGAGYDFLKQAVALMNQFSGGNSPMTREQYQLFQTAFKNLAGQQGKDLSAYSSLAQMFNLPSFTAGPLVSNTPVARLNE